MTLARFAKILANSASARAESERSDARFGVFGAITLEVEDAARLSAELGSKLDTPSLDLSTGIFLPNPPYES